MTQKMEPDLRFRFNPLLASKSAWDNRPFKEYRSEKELFSALSEKEKANGAFSYYKGYIMFKEGFYSNYRDGTEPVAYNNPNWWKTGAISCCKGCCTEPLEVCENSEPKKIEPPVYQKKQQEFRRVCGLGGLEDQFKQIADKKQISRIWLTGVGWFTITS